jgi:hypothetical protein
MTVNVNTPAITKGSTLSQRGLPAGGNTKRLKADHNLRITHSCWGKNGLNISSARSHNMLLSLENYH